MSLPREWSLQDSRGTVHRSSGPAGTFPGIAEYLQQSTATISSSTTAPASIPTVIATTETFISACSSAGNISCSNVIPTTAATAATTNNTQQQQKQEPINGNSISTDLPLQFQESDTHHGTAVPFIDCNQSGSLFSIHSAPPVPITTITSTMVDASSSSSVANVVQNQSNSLRFVIGDGEENDIPRRPISLALDSQYHSSRSIAGFQYLQPNGSGIIGGTITSSRTGINYNNPTAKAAAIAAAVGIAAANATTNTSTAAHNTNACSEIEEDDNENLLTVSSLTARPLIAKSRELRTSKLAERFNKRKSPAEPLDGGYGWFVVLGAFFVQFWVAGLVKSYGVLFVEILETFPSSSTAVASWIPAILSALCLALAPLSSALCQRFSCRSVVFVGGLFCTFGLTLSYFATSLYHLLFTFGILTGIGGGLSTTPGIIIVSLYFDKHRALANGICVSGTAAGSFVFPMLIEHLVHNFGFHGTILILGGCMLHVCASAALYRPLEDSIEDIKSIDIGGSGGVGGGGGHFGGGGVGGSTIGGLRNVASSGGLLNTTTTYLGSTAEEPNNKKYIEQLFLEESKNRINDYYNTNKFVNISEKALQNIESADDEDKDVIGETKFTFMKPMKSIRSSSLLHSVEDLSTDSTCVYKARSGFDSNRGSRRRNKNAFHTDEILIKYPGTGARGSGGGEIDSMVPSVIGNHLPQSTMQQAANRGLSKSMIIPTPISDFSEFDDCAGETKGRSRTCCEKIKRYLDITLLKDSKFIAMCLSVTMMSTGCPYMLYFLPAYALSAGYTKSEAGFLVAASAGLDLIGRLTFGYLSDLQLFDRKKAYIVCILGAGSSVLMLPSASSLYFIGCASAMYGLCLGCWYLLMPVLLADLFGTERISSSYGLVRMFQSVGAISVPPLAGFLKDLTGGYEICFYCMGTCMMLGSVPLLVSSIIHDSEPSTDESETSTAS